MEMVELLVRMDCAGCERSVRKALVNLKGVESVEVDLKRCKVTVTGYVDRKKVLKAARKTGKRVEFWPEALNYNNYNSSGYNYDYGSDNCTDNMNTTNYHHHQQQAAAVGTDGIDTAVSNYLKHSKSFARSYNYQKHGYNTSNTNVIANPSQYGAAHINYYQSSTSRYGGRDDDLASTMFSDENPNACFIM